jgi:hypothetical protein
MVTSSAAVAVTASFTVPSSSAGERIRHRR